MKKNYKSMALGAMLALGILSFENVHAQSVDSVYHPQIGKFISVRPTAQTQTIVMPSTHTFQLLAKSGTTRYSDNSGTMPGNNDFTAYVGKNNNTSSKEGYLAINHENSPGGVSILDLKLNQSNMLWETSVVRKVDFSQVASTVRNCSGGITPWGTVITSEESIPTIDANGDGYQDIGWQVEFDPATGKIMDYDGDGKPDKLWAHGRFNHENIAISNDSVTTYQTEDGGSSCVFKFVADEKANLSKGTLYVLKRDLTDPTIGVWVKMPNATQSDMNNVRTIAPSLGGTNWSSPEDIEFGPDGKMYFTSKGSGNIWRFKDNGSTVSEIEAWVTNRQYAITYNGGTQNESWGTGIDNLTFDGEGNLWALQDGGRNHLWVVRKDHTPSNPKIELFATIPAGAEPTGLTFSPDFRYGFVSIQHPNSTNTLIIKDAAGNDVRFNAASTIVFARKEFLGADAVEPVFELGADKIICKGDTLTLTAYEGTDAIVKWTGTALEDTLTGSSINVTKSGTYYATAFGDNGRRFSDEINITVEDLKVDLGYKLPLCNNCIEVLDAGAGYASYLWNDNSTAQTLMVTEPGTYSVKVTSANGCSTTGMVEVVKKNGNGNDLVPSKMIEIYPNPFKDKTNIKLSVKEEANVVLEVHTFGGKKVTTLQNGKLSVGDHYFDFTPANESKNGIYIVHLIVNNQKTSKMIKQE